MNGTIGRQYFLDRRSGSARGFDPRPALVGQLGDWRSAGYRSRFQPSRFGHHEQTTPPCLRRSHYWLALLPLHGCRYLRRSRYCRCRRLVVHGQPDWSSSFLLPTEPSLAVQPWQRSLQGASIELLLIELIFRRTINKLWCVHDIQILTLLKIINHNRESIAVFSTILTPWRWLCRCWSPLRCWTPWTACPRTSPCWLCHLGLTFGWFRPSVCRWPSTLWSSTWRFCRPSFRFARSLWKNGLPYWKYRYQSSYSTRCSSSSPANTATVRIL